MRGILTFLLFITVAALPGCGKQKANSREAAVPEKPREELRRSAADGADIDVEDEKSGTALMRATAEGSPDVIGELIEAGADIDARDEKGKTALIWAALEGQTAAVKELISYGADLNARDEMGRTPIILAAMRGHLEAVQELIAGGADVNARDSAGRTVPSCLVDQVNRDSPAELVEGIENILELLEEVGATGIPDYRAKLDMRRR